MYIVNSSKFLYKVFWSYLPSPTPLRSPPTSIPIQNHDIFFCFVKSIQCSLNSSNTHACRTCPAVWSTHQGSHHWRKSFQQLMVLDPHLWIWLCAHLPLLHAEILSAWACAVPLYVVTIPVSSCVLPITSGKHCCLEFTYSFWLFQPFRPLFDEHPRD